MTEAREHCFYLMASFWDWLVVCMLRATRRWPVPPGAQRNWEILHIQAWWH